MKILNLYAGVGGNRKLWEGHEITAVESDKKIATLYRKLYPQDKVIEGDAHAWLLAAYEQYDFIWSSPPCQSHGRMVKASRHRPTSYPDLRLYEEVIFLRHFFKGRWLVENVSPYYEPLLQPSARLGRHLIWGNFPISPFNLATPPNFINLCYL